MVCCEAIVHGKLSTAVDDFLTVHHNGKSVQNRYCALKCAELYIYSLLVCCFVITVTRK
jgi:hypothetical protein